MNESEATCRSLDRLRGHYTISTLALFRSLTSTEFGFYFYLIKSLFICYNIYRIERTNFHRVFVGAAINTEVNKL